MSRSPAETTDRISPARRSRRPLLLTCAGVIAAACALTGMAEAESTTSLRVGYSVSGMPGVTSTDAQAAMRTYCGELARQLGDTNIVLHSNVALYDTFGALTAAARDSEVHLLGMMPMEFEAMRGTVPYAPAFVGTRGGMPNRRFLVLVRRSAGIADMAHLSGREFLAGPLAIGCGALLWTECKLLKVQERHLSQAFSSVSTTSTGSAAILPVFFGQAKACLVVEDSFRTACELNPQLARDLVAVGTSPALPVGPTIALSSSLSQYARQRVVEAGLIVHTLPRGKQVLTLLRIGRFTNFAEQQIAQLSMLRDLYREQTGEGLSQFIKHYHS